MIILNNKLDGQDITMPIKEFEYDANTHVFSYIDMSGHEYTKTYVSVFMEDHWWGVKLKVYDKNSEVTHG